MIINIDLWNFDNKAKISYLNKEINRLLVDRKYMYNVKTIL